MEPGQIVLIDTGTPLQPTGIGQGIFFLPLALFLALAIVIEIAFIKKTKNWNPWLTFLSGTTVFFRIYWTAWITTFMPKDFTTYYDHETMRAKLLIQFFVFIMSAMFIPFAVFTFGRILSDITTCGISRAIIRIIPACGISYVFVQTFMIAFKFSNQIQTWW